MGRSGKGMTVSLTLRTKIGPNKKQNLRTTIIEINTQYFRKLLKKFNNLPHIGYKNKQVQNEPTEAYFSPVKYIYKLLNSNKHFLIFTQRVKSEVSGTKHSNKKIQSGIT